MSRRCVCPLWVRRYPPPPPPLPWWLAYALVLAAVLLSGYLARLLRP